MAEVFGLTVDEEITSQEVLRQYRKPPSRFVSNKVIDHVDELARRFIAASSMVVLATRRKDGGIDITPRGDPPGFVQILNDHVIGLPDRLGNNRVDAFENILHDPEVGLFFIIPGHRDSLRISGSARIVRDRALLRRMEVRGHIPDLAILVRVKRLLSHCPKAFVRAAMWDRNAWPALSDVPTAGEFLKAHGNLAEPVAEVDSVVDQDGKTRLY